MTDRIASLRESERLAQVRGASDPYGAAIRATRMPIVITDAAQPDHPIVFANDAFIALSGYPRDEIIGRNCRFLQGPETDRAQVARIAQAVRDGEHVEAELLNYRKDGVTFWNALFISPVRDAQGAVTHFFGSQLDVTERKRSAADLAEAKVGAEAEVAERTRELQRALDQKTLLLHEVDHRVKNNLQLISSLILLQSRRIRDAATRDSLRSMLNRVSALATVHRNLFQTDDLATFDVCAFVRDIASDLIDGSGRDDVAVEHDQRPVAIPATQASAVALVVNELLSSILADAFPDRPGRIRLSVGRDADTLVIGIGHDGLPASADQAESFGASLVDLLSRQLAASVERTGAAGDVAIRVTIPVSGLPASS